MRIIHAKSRTDMSRKAANILSSQIIIKPACVLGLATGSTPLGVYDQLVEWYGKDDLDFSLVKTINLDEYCGLLSESDKSYRYYMNENLFSRVNIEPGNTYLPNGIASDFTAECKRYDHLIESLGGIDMQLLGIGHNGHIGFNEPGASFEKNTHIVHLKPSTIFANARFFDSIEDVPKQAITMGIKAIMKAKKILLIADGEDKREILHAAIFGPITPDVPASALQLHPDLTVVESCNL